MRISSLLPLLLGGPLAASALDLYVAHDGNDHNAGTKAAQPFKTLQRAQGAVREALAGGKNNKKNKDGITVHVAKGTYVLSSPLRFSAEDSGSSPGQPVRWVGSDATLSGGLRVKGWTAATATGAGIYKASVPAGTVSRNLYVDGQAANYARRQITRGDFAFTAQGMTWNSTKYDFIASLPGIERAEVRFINSFTDRYAAIEAVSNRTIVMRNPSWGNQIIGYDTASGPFAEFGVYIQNSLPLLTDAGNFFLDEDAGVVYYKPFDGQDMSKAETWLGLQEAVVVVGGTYQEPAHDISFSGFTFSHTTWLKPIGFGFVDQQTGGYIGENTTYPEFEATRPHWWQMPSAIQISAASNIAISGCTCTLLGAGGIGVGNDDNAHLTGIGLGADNVSITDGYFTQVMGNAITAGGIQADAHHPSDPRMTNSHITVAGNIFFNNSALYSSTVNILATYVQYTTIEHNDIATAPYSGICLGYGWGSNDAGGSVEYTNRGLYKYQPLYQTPTTLKDNLIQANLVHDYGKMHTDLGALYTLSRDPGTLYHSNYVYDSGWYGMYPDEGSSNRTYTNNVCFSSGNWYAPNDFNAGLHTGNNSFIGNWGKSGDATLVNQPDHTGRRNNTFLSNFVVSSITQTSLDAQKAAYRAGVVPGARGSRPVSNDPSVADGFIAVSMPESGRLAVTVSNFDDVDFTKVSFEVSGSGSFFKDLKLPKSIPANSSAVATYKVTGSGSSVTATVKYKNPRTGLKSIRSATGNLTVTS